MEDTWTIDNPTDPVTLPDPQQLQPLHRRLQIAKNRFFIEERRGVGRELTGVTYYTYDSVRGIALLSDSILIRGGGTYEERPWALIITPDMLPAGTSLAQAFDALHEAIS